MAGILRRGTCGGSRSSESQDTRTYVPPTFAEATDVSEEIRERRADVGTVSYTHLTLPTLLRV